MVAEFTDGGAFHLMTVCMVCLIAFPTIMHVFQLLKECKTLTAS